jgi:hypothetical protein
MDLVDKAGSSPAPAFDVVLQQHDPLGICGGAEGRLGGTLKVAEHALVDALATVVVGGVRLNRDQEIVGVHPGAQRRRDALESIDGDAFELVG